ncbi:MAG: hypothetical protein ACKO82_00315, partial [Acidimicrobiaceae bacterium]
PPLRQPPSSDKFIIIITTIDIMLTTNGSRPTHYYQGATPVNVAPWAVAADATLASTAAAVVAVVAGASNKYPSRINSHLKTNTKRNHSSGNSRLPKKVMKTVVGKTVIQLLL